MILSSLNQNDQNIISTYFRMDDEKLTETFFTHIRAGDLDKVSSLAAFDPSLLRRSLKSMTPLMEASYKGIGFSVIKTFSHAFFLATIIFSQKSY